jgi:hypothetical protein
MAVPGSIDPEAERSGFDATLAGSPRKGYFKAVFPSKPPKRPDFAPESGGFQGSLFTIWIIVRPSILSGKCLILHLLSIPRTGNASPEVGILGGGRGVVVFIGFRSAPPRREGTAGRRGGHPFGGDLACIHYALPERNFRQTRLRPISCVCAATEAARASIPREAKIALKRATINVTNHLRPLGNEQNQLSELSSFGWGLNFCALPRAMARYLRNSSIAHIWA